MIRNRGERIAREAGGVRCDWKWSTALHYCNVFPTAGRRLMERALRDWPIVLADGRADDGPPDVTFLIGHRGSARLPLLLETLRSIAGQRGARVECLVVEQAHVIEARDALPSWVRYLHTPAAKEEPYRRAATFNDGAALARGRMLVLHDNDLVVPADYAAELLRLANEGYEAIDRKRFVFYRGEHGEIEQVVQNVRGGSVAITRDAYAAVGGFDEAFVGWGGEDVEFWERAETRRATAAGALPLVHLWHPAQPEKLQGREAPAIARYYEVAQVPPEERIRRLRA